MFKEMSFCHKLKFSNPYIFKTLHMISFKTKLYISDFITEPKTGIIVILGVEKLYTRHSLVLVDLESNARATASQYSATPGFI